MSRDSKAEKEEREKPVESIYLNRKEVQHRVESDPQREASDAPGKFDKVEQSPYHLQLQNNRTQSRPVKPEPLAVQEFSSKPSMFSQ